MNLRHTTPPVPLIPSINKPRVNITYFTSNKIVAITTSPTLPTSNPLLVLLMKLFTLKTSFCGWEQWLWSSFSCCNIRSLGCRFSSFVCKLFIEMTGGNADMKEVIWSRITATRIQLKTSIVSALNRAILKGFQTWTSSLVSLCGSSFVSNTRLWPVYIL